MTDERVLIITSDAGFGHRSAAKGVQKALQELTNGGVDAIVSNPVEEPDVAWLVKRIEQGYDEVVTDDPTLYQIAYTATDAPMLAQIMQDVTTTVIHKTLTSMLQKHKPKLVLNTFPAYIQASVVTARAMPYYLPVDVIVTDLTENHSLWFNKGVDMTFVPTGAAYKQALVAGIAKEKTQVTGIPVPPHFLREARSRAQLRRELGWDEAAITCLIVGSVRARQTVSTAHLLDRSGLPLQLAVVAGGDAEAEAQLRATQWRGQVHTYGYVTNLPEMLLAADFLVCKAGGLIVTEALAAGLPLILNEALPGQEVGNVRYVVENGAGVWAPGPINVLATAYAWLANDCADMEKCRAASKRLGKPRSSLDIAERIIRQIQALA